MCFASKMVKNLKMSVFSSYFIVLNLDFLGNQTSRFLSHLQINAPSFQELRVFSQGIGH